MKLPSAPPKQSRFLRSQQDLKAKFEQQSAEGGGGGECDGGFCCCRPKLSSLSSTLDILLEHVIT